jgi:hypothetical protein
VKTACATATSSSEYRPEGDSDRPETPVGPSSVPVDLSADSPTLDTTGGDQLGSSHGSGSLRLGTDSVGGGTYYMPTEPRTSSAASYSMGSEEVPVDTQGLNLSMSQFGLPTGSESGHDTSRSQLDTPDLPLGPSPVEKFSPLVVSPEKPTSFSTPEKVGKSSTGKGQGPSKGKSKKTTVKVGCPPKSWERPKTPTPPPSPQDNVGPAQPVGTPTSPPVPQPVVPVPAQPTPPVEVGQPGPVQQLNRSDSTATPVQDKGGPGWPRAREGAEVYYMDIGRNYWSEFTPAGEVSCFFVKNNTTSRLGVMRVPSSQCNHSNLRVHLDRAGDLELFPVVPDEDPHAVHLLAGQRIPILCSKEISRQPPAPSV